MKSAVLALLVSVFCAASIAADAPETIFKLSGWTYARERKTVTGSNRVTASVTVKNASKTVVSDVTLTLTYATGLGEKVAGPLTQKAGAMKPGESKTLTLVAEFIPVFQSYDIAIQFNGNKKEDWFGNSDTAQPEAKLVPVKGEANVVILGKEATVDQSGLFSGTVHVKNEGTEAATNVKIFVIFFDLRKNKIKEWSAPLGTGTIAGGADANIPFTMPGAPRNYGAYTIRLNSDDAPPEAALAGGDFTSVEDVEFAHFKFTHTDAKNASYKVEVDCRNGFKNSVDHVKLEMIFYGPKKREVKRFNYEIPGSIAAGEIKSVSFDIPGLPAYEEYEQRISFGKADAAPIKTSTESKAAKFRNKPDVEIVFGPLAENAEKVVVLNGAVRNGKNFPVKDVSIHFTFLNASGKEFLTADRTLSSTLKPGEEKEFPVYVQKAAGAANFTFAFKYVEAAP